MTPAAGLCVVMGASGLLGQALRREAARRAVPIIGMARANADELVDVTDWPLLQAKLDAMRPATVINAAALTNLETCEREPLAAYSVNARVVAFLAGYCAVHAIKLVQVSTDHYFPGAGNRLHDESSPVRLVNEYARTKYAGEAFAATCASALVLRTNIVGFRGWAGRPTFVEWALEALQSGAPLTLFDDFFTSSIDVGAFARALFDLLIRGSSGLLNVAARDAASKRDFVMGLAGRLGLPTAQCRTGSARDLASIPRATSLGLDVSRAEEILGYRLPDTQAVLDVLASEFKGQQHALR